MDNNHLSLLIKLKIKVPFNVGAQPLSIPHCSRYVSMK